MKQRARTRETQQRRVVYEAIKSTNTHPTADWIFEHVRETMPKISLGTVYRNLAVLKNEGMIREIYGQDRRAHYDAEMAPHAHFVCDGCHEIWDVHATPDIEWRSIKELVGCQVREIRMEFAGLCPACERRSEA